MQSSPMSVQMSGRILPGLLLVLLHLILILAACDEQPVIPTLAVTAVAPPTMAPTDTPAKTALPATASPTKPSSTATPSPTAAPSLTPVVPVLQETPYPQSGVNITSPPEGEEIVQGSDAHIGGLIQIGESETLTVALVDAFGQRISNAEVTVHEFGNWVGTIDIPLSYAGSARLSAVILNSQGDILASDEHGIVLVTDRQASDQYLDLLRPHDGDTVAAGFNMFFDGWVQQPVNNVVSISLWVEECQVRIARQSFILRGSGYWQGFLIVPAGESGPACAQAHFGEQGTEEYREAVVDINVLPSNSPDSYGVLIGNPPPRSTVNAGQLLELYGTAYNAANGEVQVTIRTEDSRLVTEGFASADIWGYWELSLFIPDEVSGLAEISATIGDKDRASYAENRILVDILSE